jgi:hypothetical protein
LMTWPIILFSLLGAFALSGVACIIWIGICWRTVGRHVSDLWPKKVTKAIQLIAGSTSVFGVYSVGAAKGDWLPAAWSGVACVVIWEIVGQLIDNRIKIADKIDKAALGRAEFQSTLRTQLLTVFRRAVDGKARRTRRQLEHPTRKIGIPHVRNALRPQPHLGELLQNLADFFRFQLLGGAEENRNFRVGVYVNVEETMTPVECISLNDSSYTPFKSYQAHQSAFRLDVPTNPSQVVNCVRQRRMIIVEDCAKAADEGDFYFFTAEQRSYLRSMVVFYLGEVSEEDGTIAEGVLVVDTEAVGFFKESDRDSIEFCLREFAARLRLEMLLIALLPREVQTHENSIFRRKGPQTGTTPEEAASTDGGDEERRSATPQDYPGTDRQEVNTRKALSPDGGCIG